MSANQSPLDQSENEVKMMNAQWNRIALLAVSMASAAWAGTEPLYELHVSGSIWQYTGVPCNGNSCPGWIQLDSNPEAVGIVAGGGKLFQLHNNGSVWEYTGVPCNANGCTGWIEVYIATPPQLPEIFAYGGELYQLRGVLPNTSVWQFTGQACNGGSCPGWIELDNANGIITLFPGGAGLFEERWNGSTFDLWGYTGTPCFNSVCSGWAQVDFPDSESIASGIYAAYETLLNGVIRQYVGPPCDQTGCHWVKVDSNSTITQIVAGGSLYKGESDGSVWQYTGTPCHGDTCPGWVQLDNNPNLMSIVAGLSTVYQIHKDQSIWHYLGTPCNGNSCPSWEMLDNNPNLASIAVGF